MRQDENRVLTIPVVLGSVRAERQSDRPAYLLVDRVRAAGHLAELVDLGELDLPIYGQRERWGDQPSVQSFRRVMATAEAVIWLSPEYTHSYTAATKNALDYLHTELRRKPVAVCGLSGGKLGGARMAEQLKLVLIDLHAVPIRDSIYFSEARGVFDAYGRLLRQEYLRRIDEVVAALAWYALALRWGRENLPIPVEQES